ncbi:hypothetical protein TNCV_4429841 [Trichonephila clavipes]|nr:hypothetical protein TNCV_4429841 [Trichonephila clavipes]
MCGVAKALLDDIRSFQHSANKRRNEESLGFPAKSGLGSQVGSYKGFKLDVSQVWGLVLFYPLGVWGGHPGARISWTLPGFLVINCDPSVPRGPVDFLPPGPEMSLNRHCSSLPQCEGGGYVTPLQAWVPLSLDRFNVHQPLTQ